MYRFFEMIRRLFEAVENTDGKRQGDEIDAIILIASFDIVSGYLK